MSCARVISGSRLWERFKGKTIVCKSWDQIRMLLLARDCLPEIASRIARARTTKDADLQENELGNIKTSRESQNAAQRTSHPLSRCQNFLTKRPFKLVFLLTNWDLYNSSFVTIWEKFGHNLNFWVLSQFEFGNILRFLSFVTILILSQFDFFSFVTF